MLACPACGRQPRFVTWWQNATFGNRDGLHWGRYECVRWFGLVVHLRGKDCANVKEWRDLLEPNARAAWDNAVTATPARS